MTTSRARIVIGLMFGLWSLPSNVTAQPKYRIAWFEFLRTPNCGVPRMNQSGQAVAVLGDLPMTMLLDGKTAIITGAASARGIGRATAQLFAAHGARSGSTTRLSKRPSARPPL